MDSSSRGLKELRMGRENMDRGQVEGERGRGKRSSIERGEGKGGKVDGEERIEKR